MQTSDQPSQNPFEKLTSYLPLFWLSLAFLCGIWAAEQVHRSRSGWLAFFHTFLPAQFPFGRGLWLLLASLAVLAAVLAGVFHVRLRGKLAPATQFLILLAVIVFCVGAARYAYTVPRVDAHYISWYNDGEYQILVTGTLASPPDVRDSYTNLRLQVSKVETGEQAVDVSGLMLARVSSDQVWQYGEVVRLRGHLQTPPSNEDFSYQDYLSHQGILAYMPDAEATLLPFSGGSPLLRLIYNFKAYALERVYRIFPEPEASLLAGILLGDDSGMPAGLQQAYVNTGTAHIIAISGFNIAILAWLFIWLFSRLLGERKGAIAAIIGIAVYTVLVGATASVVRAAIMGTLAIFARQVGRRQNGLNTLAFTGAVMACINPNVLWDVGFQLSFAATLGMILYAGPLQDWFTGLLSRRLASESARKVGGTVGSYVLFTLAAQLTTLPVMAYQFKQVSLVAVVANPFILPVQPAVEVLSGLALLLSLVYLPLGKLAGWLAWPFAAYTDRAVEFFNRFPHSVLVLGEFSALFVVLFYLVLFGITFASQRLQKPARAFLTPTVILGVLGVYTFLAWSAVFSLPDKNLHLTFFDVGSANAILIQTPTGRNLLVDGGASPSTLADALGRRLSPFQHQLDWLVVASPQEQELAALPGDMALFPAGNVLWAGNPDASYSAEQLNLWLADHDTPVTPAYRDAALDLGQGASLKVTSVSPSGAVLLVEWQGFRALLPVGMNFDTLTELDNGNKLGNVSVLLLADAGLAQVNPPEWLAALQPRLAILSVAAGDPDGLPDQSVLDTLAGTTLLRTDRNGWIEVSTNGSGMWVDVEKK
ncbi:MAG TPA: ComEC/Rec2 family competence protein [Anaerolineales bacterium]|nr:ComEC/Rec2 family competence protein [Anaerolineales bacterium]